MKTNLSKSYIVVEKEVELLEDLAANLYINSCSTENMTEQTKQYIYNLNDIVNHLRDYYAGQVYKDLGYVEKMNIKVNE